MKNLYLFAITLLFFGCESNLNSDVGGGSGRGGSLARFAVINDYLYVVDNNNLKVFDVTKSGDPIFRQKVPINAFAETIFPFGKHLLIGTRTGMYIFSIADPARPAFVSQYNHVASCDPVVADGDFAYVTLRNGTPCQRGQNQLDVIDIKEITSPRILKSIQLLNPHGLGVDGNLLFVTEGNQGLKVYDRTNPADPKLVNFLSEIPAFDVIPLNKTLIVTGNDGIFQFEYEKNGDMKQLSKIAVVK